MSKSRSQCDTSPCAAGSGQDPAEQGRTWQQSSVPEGEWRSPLTGGTDVSLAHGLPGKPAGGTPLTTPLKSYQVEMF